MHHTDAEIFTGQYKWEEIGSITVSHSELAVGSRDEASVAIVGAGKTVELAPPLGACSYAIRCRMDGAEEQQVVLQQHYCTVAETDYWSRMATLTVTQGQQLYSGSIYFADSVVESNGEWPTDRTALYEEGSNYIGCYYFNTHGCKFLWIASTLPTGVTVYIDALRIS